MADETETQRDDRVALTQANNLRRERLPQPVPDAHVLHWRIYYSNGVMVNSNEASWEAAPNRHIVAVVQAINEEPASVELGTPYYWHFGDWIGRVWDPTLYLRQTALVKFGRWASHGKFDAAWRHALLSIEPDGGLITNGMLESGVVSTRKTVGHKEQGVTWAVWYDDHKLYKSDSCTWEQLPSDGVLAFAYSVVYSGIKLSFALRRYTYWFWREHELFNTDDLDEVLAHFPQCKYGATGFEGKSYRHQAEAIAAALKDDLQDVRHVWKERP